MAREIEAKYRVESLAPLQTALRRLGAVKRFSAVQTDRYFDTPQRALLCRDCGVRLRELQAVRAGEIKPDTRAELTYKGARAKGRLKSRPEYQTHVDHPEAVVELLEAVGLEQTLVIQKRRQSYRLGRCLVELDELPLIGTFVEIEGPSESAIATIASRLGLQGEPVADHYVALLLAACKGRRGRVDRITFGCPPIARGRRSAAKGR